MTTYTAPPTVDDFLKRFPGFNGFPTETIDLVLEEAIHDVGSTWVDRDRFHAMLYLTAHLLWTQEQGVIDPNAGNDTSGGGSTSTVMGGELKRRKVGDVEVEWAVGSTTTSSSGSGNPGGGAVTAAYWESVYGRRYLELMRRSFPAARVV